MELPLKILNGTTPPAIAVIGTKSGEHQVFSLAGDYFGVTREAITRSGHEGITYLLKIEGKKLRDGSNIGDNSSKFDRKSAWNLPDAVGWRTS